MTSGHLTSDIWQEFFLLRGDIWQVDIWQVQTTKKNLKGEGSIPEVEIRNIIIFFWFRPPGSKPRPSDFFCSLYLSNVPSLAKCPLVKCPLVICLQAVFSASIVGKTWNNFLQERHFSSILFLFCQAHSSAHSCVDLWYKNFPTIFYEFFNFENTPFFGIS